MNQEKMMFEFFPNNYPWNLNAALAFVMGGEMSEIADACGPLSHINESTPHAAAVEAWFQSWSIIGQRMERLAAENQARDWSFTAGAHYFRAVDYQLIAERVMSWTDPRRVSTYRHALENFDKACRLSGHKMERVEVVNEKGEPLSGYLRLPEGDGPFPAIIFFNGFDSIKEMHYLLYAKDAAKRGIGVIYIDQEGTGEAMRLHKIVKRIDSENSAAPFIDYLEARADIDSNRIGVAGISNGGYDAPRAAAFEPRLKCVACLGAFYNGDDYLGRFEDDSEVTVTEGIADLDDHMMTVMGAKDPETAYRMFAARDLGPAIDKVRVPLLVVHGENDRQVPLFHAERTVAGAINSPRVDYKLFSLSDGAAEHCGGNNTMMHARYLFDWCAEILGGRVRST
jgi:dipeptidyl aminopeptidase/acylaminoacyl peptidase